MSFIMSSLVLLVAGATSAPSTASSHPAEPSPRVTLFVSDVAIKRGDSFPIIVEIANPTGRDYLYSRSLGLRFVQNPVGGSQPAMPNATKEKETWTTQVDGQDVLRVVLEVAVPALSESRYDPFSSPFDENLTEAPLGKHETKMLSKKLGGSAFQVGECRIRAFLYHRDEVVAESKTMFVKVAGEAEVGR